MSESAYQSLYNHSHQCAAEEEILVLPEPVEETIIEVSPVEPELPAPEEP